MWRSPSRPDRTALLFALLLPFVMFSGAGCSGCELDCGAPGSPYTFEGELVDVEGRVASFADDDAVVRVEIVNRINFLDVGESYLVPTTGRSNVADYTAQINSSCSCDASITHADGATIDTGFWRQVKESRAAQFAFVLFVGVPALTLIGVTVNRIRYGAVGDPYTGLPDDGSWIEYDDEL